MNARVLSYLAPALWFATAFFVHSSLAAEEKVASNDPDAGRATELRVQAATLATSGDYISAEEMFSRSIEVARQVDDTKSRDWTLLFIATAQARAGGIHAGIETANSIETEAYQNWALRDIAPIQAATGDLSGALETVRNISREGVRAHALGGIAVSQARAGDIMGAGVIADKIEEPGMKARAYAAITRARAQPR